MMNNRTVVPSQTSSLVLALCAALALAGCAPEPNEVPEEVAVDNAVESWEGQQSVAEAPEKRTTLPDSFPSEIVIPEEAIIDDAGERDGNAWFVTFATESLDAATELRDRIAEDSRLTPQGDAEQTADGGAWVSYTKGTLHIDSLTLAPSPTHAYLSLDITEFVH